MQLATFLQSLITSQFNLNIESNHADSFCWSYFDEQYQVAQDWPLVATLYLIHQELRKLNCYYHFKTENHIIPKACFISQ